MYKYTVMKLNKSKRKNYLAIFKHKNILIQHNIYRMLAKYLLKNKMFEKIYIFQTLIQTNKKLT